MRILSTINSHFTTEEKKKQNESLEKRAKHHVYELAKMYLLEQKKPAIFRSKGIKCRKQNLVIEEIKVSLFTSILCKLPTFFRNSLLFSLIAIWAILIVISI